MAPAKADVEHVVESSKRKESEDEALSSVTSSLTCLTLHTDSHKELAGLEAGVSQISLDEKPLQEEDLDKQVKQEEAKEKQDEQEEDEEKQTDQEEEKDKRDDESERSSAEEKDNEKKINAVEIKISGGSKKLTDSEMSKESKESQDGEEEEEEEEEEKEVLVEGDEGTSLDKSELKEEEEVVSDDENVTKDKKGYTKEEEVSDSENATAAGDDQPTQPQGKKGKLRPRGFGHAMSQNYMTYVGGEAYQQQQYPQNQEIWAQSQYPGLLVSQCAQEGGYPGSSPSAASGEWHGSTQLDALSGKTFIPSLGEYSPASCTSGEDDVSSASYGNNAESPLGYQDTMYSTSPQYQENQLSPYQQDLFHNSQHQDCQPVLYHQQQDNQTSSFHPGFSQSVQYQESQATPYYQGSPQMLSPQSYQEAPSPMQFLSASQSHGPHPYLTPPVSPQPNTTPTSVTHSDEDIGEIISYVAEKVPVEISPDDDTLFLGIIKNLLEMPDNVFTQKDGNIEEGLDKEMFDQLIRGFATMKNEDLVNGDNDGDIFYTRILCTGQMESDYKERVVACTKRIENIDLCCDTVVDWRVKRCQTCGNSDPSTFYSPLSWRNHLNEMPLSSLVMLLFPPPVVEYITKKVMQRPMDLKRTFVQNYDFFYGKAKLYPCLLEGLKSLQSV